MLNDNEKQKIKNFVSDKVLSGAVKGVLRESFMKTSGAQEVHTLAAERIAINLLDEGFKELNKYAKQTEQEHKDREQVGL